MTPTDQEDAIAHLRSHGWCRIPSVLTPSEASTVLYLLWKAAKTNESRGEDTYLPFLDPNSSSVRVFYLLELHEKFRDLILHPTAIEFVQSVLGPDYIISNFSANIARPGSGIWCLTDIRMENGATMYIPGSNAWTTRADIPSDAPSKLNSFEAKAGDFLVIDGRLWHTSGKNMTKDEDRALLFGYYTKPFVRQQVNWSAKLERGLQDTLSEELKARLGLGPQGNICVVGDFRYLDVQFSGVNDDEGKGNMNDS
ncbi:phytanoyl-CoA dioxygenase family protein [Xylariaceae sp. FL1272]|nr:phytanoyl-CoA dioxygenase family protein [Xylariaceae sp. FL1272]